MLREAPAAVQSDSVFRHRGATAAEVAGSRIPGYHACRSGRDRRVRAAAARPQILRCPLRCSVSSC